MSSFSTTKFVEWFPSNPADFANLFKALAGPCRTLYDDFVNKGQGNCGLLLDCVLEHGISELQKTTIAGAQVILGLIPSLLASVGNSVPEVSVLASQRPMLTLLLTLEAPGMYPTRVTTYVHPLDVLARATSRGVFSAAAKWAIGRPLLILLQYLLAMAIAANNLELSLRVGSRSVLSWGCRSWWMPLVWVLFPLSTYAFAAVSCHTVARKTQRTNGSNWCGWIRWVPVEVTLSSSLRFLQVHLGLPPLRRGVLPSISVMIYQAAASCLALVHLILGTIILSCLIFVGFHDTLVILARFLASAIVARMIALLQLEAIRSQFDEAYAAGKGRRIHDNSAPVLRHHPTI